MESLCSSLPSGQHSSNARVAESAYPDISARVFKKTEELIIGQSITSGIDRFWTGVRKLFGAIKSRVAHQSLCSRDPPFSCVVLKRRLIPAPAPVGNSL